MAAPPPAPGATNYGTTTIIMEQPITSATATIPSTTPSNAQVSSVSPQINAALGLITMVDRLYIEDPTLGTDLSYYESFKNIVDRNGLRLFILLFDSMTTVGMAPHGGTAQVHRTTLRGSMTIADSSGLPILIAQRNLDESYCAWSYIINSIDTPSIGSFRSDCCCTDTYTVVGPDATYSVRPKKLLPFCTCCCCCLPAFVVKNKAKGGDRGRLGEMRINWPENRGVFGIDYAPGVPPLQKLILLLSGAVLNGLYFTEHCCCRIGPIGCRRLWLGIWSGFHFVLGLTILLVIFVLIPYWNQVERDPRERGRRN